MGWTWLGFRVRHGTQDGFLKKYICFVVEVV